MSAAQARMRAARLHGRLYLVVDPRPGAEIVLPKIEAALRGGVDIVQIWNHWAPEHDARAFVAQTLALARPRAVPVLVHERIDLLESTSADGIHFDVATLTPAEVRDAVGRDVQYGVTCGNDLERVHCAVRDGASYVSFCAMFPSPSSAACKIVSLETIRRARELADVRIFASGGITPENAATVLDAGADGVAVISGILGAGDAEAAARRYADVIHSKYPAGTRP